MFGCPVIFGCAARLSGAIRLPARPGFGVYLRYFARGADASWLRGLPAVLRPGGRARSSAARGWLLGFACFDRGISAARLSRRRMLFPAAGPPGFSGTQPAVWRSALSWRLSVVSRSL